MWRQLKSVKRQAAGSTAEELRVESWELRVESRKKGFTTEGAEEEHTGHREFWQRVGWLDEADEAACGYDGEPEKKRYEAGDFCAHWGYFGVAPGDTIAVNGAMENEGLQAS